MANGREILASALICVRGRNFGSIFEAKMDQTSTKNRSQNGCKMCMHVGIDFFLIFTDLGAQDGPPRGGSKVTKMRPGTPKPPQCSFR